MLHTVELLESILYELPTRDLLLAQRVNKQWQAVVGSSKKLQRALFFAPVSGPPLEVDGIDDGEYWLTSWTRGGVKTDCKPLQNPLLGTLFRGFGRTVDQIVITLSGELSPCWLRQHASWKRMLSTQPPTRSQISIYMHDEDELAICGTGEDRMGDVFGKLEQQWKCCYPAAAEVVFNGIRSCSYLQKTSELEDLAA